MRTKPVSAKTIAKRMAYVAVPCSAMMALKCLSKCRTKSVSPAPAILSCVGINKHPEPFLSRI